MDKAAITSFLGDLWRKELYRLGEKRAQAVRGYLVETFNLDENRLFICNPTLSFGESARGNVEFRK